MSGKKLIQINPKFLKIGGKKKSTREKRSKSTDLRTSIKPNDIKKKLMSRIKDHHNKSIQSGGKEEEATEKFTKDFNDQMSYLEKIIASKKKKKKKRRTRKSKSKEENTDYSGIKVETPTLAKKLIPSTEPSRVSPPSSTMIPSPVPTNSVINIHREPRFGCLKGGIKPTYSEYRKTLKKNESKNETKKDIISFEPLPIATDSVKERRTILERLKEKIAIPKIEPKKRLKRRKKTIKIHHLGKNKKMAHVSVLIKSGKTRKRVQNEQDVLRSKCLSEVKLYLRKHNLIKAGTSAPEDILRKLYEDSFLAGNIFNKNPDNLLHNYLSKELDN